MEQRLEALKEDLDLPAQTIEFQELNGGGFAWGQGRDDPDDFFVPSARRYDPSVDPGDGEGKRPRLVALGFHFRGNWNQNIEL